MKVVIIGASAYGQVYLRYLQESCDYEIVGFLDDDQQLVGKEIENIPVLGTTEKLDIYKRQYGVEGVFVPIGNNEARTRILAKAQESNLMTPGYVHPTAIVSSDAKIGSAVYVLPHSVIMPYVHIRDYVMISISVNVAHHTILGRGVFLSTGVNMGAGIDVGERAYVGIGSTIMTGVKSIGSNSYIGAGAVVIRDVSEATTVVGVPAKPLPRKQEDKV